MKLIYSLLCSGSISILLISNSLFAADIQQEKIDQTEVQQTETHSESEVVTESTLTAETELKPSTQLDLGRYRLTVGLGPGLKRIGYVMGAGVKLFSREDEKGIHGLIVNVSRGVMISSHIDKNDPSVTYDYEARYERTYQEISLEYEWLSSKQGFGYQLGMGYRKEQGQVERDYSRQQSIPVFFGDQSRTVDESKESSSDFEKTATIYSAGAFIQQRAKSISFNENQFRFGLQLALPVYRDGNYKIRTPEGTEQTHSLSDRPLLGMTFNVYMSWII